MVSWHDMWVFIYLWLIMQSVAAVLLLMSFNVQSPVTDFFKTSFKGAPVAVAPSAVFPGSTIYPVYRPEVLEPSVAPSSSLMGKGYIQEIQEFVDRQGK